MTKKILIICAIILVLVLAASLALAQGGPGRGRQGRGGPGPGGRHPAYGELTAKDGGSWTIRPEIPAELRERMDERGRELPELPDELTFTVTDKTKFTLAGEQAGADDFSVGDMIVVVLKPGDDGPVAARIADPESAKKFIGERLREFREGRGEGGFGRGDGMGMGPGEGMGMGPGEGMGPGGPGEGPGMGPGRRPRPAFGVITAIDGDTLTLRPEVPPFIADKLAERGVEPPQDLPESLTVTIGERTRFLVAGEEVAELPFGVGDSVAVMGGLRGDRPAFAITDYATVEQRMAEGPWGEGGPDGPPGPPPGAGPAGPPRE